jgi:hypothetical protein
LPQDEDRPSFSSSPHDDSPFIILIDAFENDISNKVLQKKKFYEGSQRFQDAWIVSPLVGLVCC